MSCYPLSISPAGSGGEMEEKKEMFCYPLSISPMGRGGREIAIKLCCSVREKGAWRSLSFLCSDSLEKWGEKFKKLL